MPVEINILQIFVSELLWNVRE